MKKAQIICVGASSLYGIGSPSGGWADLLKAELHQRMYGNDGLGQLWQVYNLGVSGANLANQVERTIVFLKSIERSDYERLVLIQGGANNALALDTPDNFVATPEQYKEELIAFLNQLIGLGAQVIGIGLLPMDEAKVSPVDEISKRKAYFNNQRNKLFEDVFGSVCQQLSLPFIPLFAAAEAVGWIDNYQYEDGIHPNAAGQDWILEQIRPSLAEFLGQ